MSEDDADVCGHCLHPVDRHGPAGCEEWTARAELGGFPVICDCSEHPDPYDPSAP